jgi:hypothetical protein
MTELILPPLKPIPIKDRISVVYVEKGNLDVLVPRVRGDEPVLAAWHAALSSIQ